jgi:hypothetical protein
MVELLVFLDKSVPLNWKLLDKVSTGTNLPSTQTCSKIMNRIYMARNKENVIEILGPITDMEILNS